MTRFFSVFFAFLVATESTAHEPSLLRVDSLVADENGKYYYAHVSDTDRDWLITCAGYDEADRVVDVGQALSTSPATQVRLESRGFKISRAGCTAKRLRE